MSGRLIIDYLLHGEADSKITGIVLLFFGMSVLTSIPGYLMLPTNLDFLPIAENEKVIISALIFPKRIFLHYAPLQALLGLMMVTATVGVYKSAAWGKKIAKASAVLFLVYFSSFSYSYLYSIKSSEALSSVPYLFSFMLFGGIMTLIAIAPFIYLTLKYLDRLPVLGASTQHDDSAAGSREG